MDSSYMKSYTNSARALDRPAAFALLMRKVYTWMTLALAVTGLTAYYCSTNYDVINAIASNSLVFWGLIIAQLGAVMYLSVRINNMSLTTAGIVFLLYAVLTGVTFSFIFLVYTMESIASTFFITAGTFGAMSLVGYFIKKDLSAIGRFLIMALIGLIIASIVNIFLQSSGLTLICTYAGVLIFSGLTAYDTQKIKQMFLMHGAEMNESTMKLALMGSLTLYLDFINLFLYLLRIFGDRK
ncbi:MAG: Bax inhibitor-1/YccA family protein [Bacteroidaceae bacterium]|nr:Bax inhibitor-1/YccA family protein [Bacteroidaceae bacterium]